MEFDRQKPMSQFESENDCTSSFERAIMGLEDLRKTRNYSSVPCWDYWLGFTEMKTCN
jgi:hypothetical protein